MTEEIIYDEKLWFEHKGCEGKHYLLGNPHTVAGRMLAWCLKENRSFFISKPDIGERSEFADYWIKGFLSGNQPEPPLDENGTAFGSKEYEEWQKKIEEFEKTGRWEHDEV